MESELARRMHRLVEPLHTWIYVAPEAKPAYEDAGLKGMWMGYFASRSAPMGPVPAEVTLATFYHFGPALVRRAIPDAWTLSSPDRVLAARWRVADEGMRRLLAEQAAGPEVKEAAALLREATAACEPYGRTLFAGHAALEWPDEPHAQIWHAATLLREFRGDGHVATLVAAGVTPRASLLLHVGVKPDYADFVRSMRGWTPEELDGTQAELVARGWLETDGAATAAGKAARDDIERTTDELAMAPWRALGPDRTERLTELLTPLADAVKGS